jgi:oxygen-independent coproporphyrinogen-3 oxidase
MSPTDDSMPSGLYVHVPFCHSECTYCDFYRVGYREAAADRFLDALAIELSALPRPFRPRTLYVGGGTPSALREAQIERLLRLLEPFRAGVVEYTFEVNPRSANDAKVDSLAAAGVTRASFGAQTFKDSALELLGRRHRSEDVRQAFRRLRSRIASISFDLIFAWPGETLDEWQADLDAAVAMGPDHLSAYSLIYEPGTPIAGRVLRGELSPVSEEVERAMFIHAMRRLKSAGFEHYEVSSYARPGHRSLHNQAYWEQEDYVGVGPGACSTVGSVRTVNSRDLEGYVRGLEEAGAPPRVVENISMRQKLDESILLGLRTSGGLRLAEFRERAGKDLGEYSGGRLAALLSAGLLNVSDNVLTLTEDGLCVADRVIAELMAGE